MKHMKSILVLSMVVLGGMALHANDFVAKAEKEEGKKLFRSMVQTLHKQEVKPQEITIKFELDKQSAGILKSILNEVEDVKSKKGLLFGALQLQGMAKPENIDSIEIQVRRALINKPAL